MNDIPHQQNSEQALRLLAAQRRQYSQAKKITALQASVSLATPVLAASLVALSEDLKPWTALLGLCVTLADLGWFEPAEQSWKRTGALLQEKFDCLVLQLPWNSCLAATEPDSEEWATAPSDDASLRDWYPAAVGQLPLSVARALCQRTNCWWDGTLRRTYSRALYTVAVLVPFAGTVVGLFRSMTLADFVLSIAAPALPAVAWTLREAGRQAEAADAMARLKTTATRLWENILKGSVPEDEATRQSRQVQDAILAHRRAAPLVFDWVYWVFREKQENQMKAAVQQMLSETQQ